MSRAAICQDWLHLLWQGMLSPQLKAFSRTAVN